MNEEKYYSWLASLVNPDGRGDEYQHLLEQMHLTIFSDDTAKLIPNDSNRVEDGINLREKYCVRYHVKNIDDIYTNECSLLELIIGLSIRMENQFGIKDSVSWFWEIIANLQLTHFDDESYEDQEQNSFKDVSNIIDRFLNRRYSKNGDGGLFPLLYPSRDQRNLEIWHQMNDYLNENY